MCLSVPLQVVSVDSNIANLEDGRKANLSLVGKVKKGSWLLVKSNLAVEKLTAKEAMAMRSLAKEVSNELKFA